MKQRKEDCNSYVVCPGENSPYFGTIHSWPLVARIFVSFLGLGFPLSIICVFGCYQMTPAGEICLIPPYIRVIIFFVYCVILVILYYLCPKGNIKW